MKREVYRFDAPKWVSFLFGMVFGLLIGILLFGLAIGMGGFIR